MSSWTAALVALYVVGAVWRMVKLRRSLAPVSCDCCGELVESPTERNAAFMKERYGVGRRAFLLWSYVASAILWPLLFAIEFWIGFAEGWRMSRGP